MNSQNHEKTARYFVKTILPQTRNSRLLLFFFFLEIQLHHIIRIINNNEYYFVRGPFNFFHFIYSKKYSNLKIF